MINRKASEGSYVTSWAGFEFLPGALAGLALLAESDVAVVVVTNQRGVALGKMTEADLEDIHARMQAAIAAAGGRVDGIYYCPHGAGCSCRKPETGMFEHAAGDFGLTLTQTVVIGDQPSDILAARRIGALAVMVIGEPVQVSPTRLEAPRADHVVSDLTEAVRWLGDCGYLRPA